MIPPYLLRPLSRAEEVVLSRPKVVATFAPALFSI